MGDHGYSVDARRDLISQGRRKRALEMLMSGKSFKEISEEMQLHEMTVRGYLDTELAELGATSLALASSWRSVTFARLEKLLRAIWPQALNGDFKALEQVRGIIADERKLLAVDSQLVQKAELVAKVEHSFPPSDVGEIVRVLGQIGVLHQLTDGRDVIEGELVPSSYEDVLVERS